MKKFLYLGSALLLILGFYLYLYSPNAFAAQLPTQDIISDPSSSYYDQFEQQTILSFPAFKGVTPLFDKEYHPTPLLAELLTLVGMTEEPKDLFSINEWAQKNLLRKGERWETQRSQFEALSPKLEPLLNQLGFIHEITPSFITYDGALLHGALLGSVRKRLYYLIQQWNSGVRFGHLYLLGGERPLQPGYEDRSLLLSDPTSPLHIRSDWIPPSTLPQTESEMMLLVWNQSTLPKGMRDEVIIHIINAPMNYNQQTGLKTRPNTADTIVSWLKNSPPPGRYLAISNAPYILRQDIIARRITPRNYLIDTIGPQVRAQEKMIIILDEVARYIFELSQLAQQDKLKRSA